MLALILALQGNEVNVRVFEDYSRGSAEKRFHTHAPVFWAAPGTRLRMQAECLQPKRRVPILITTRQEEEERVPVDRSTEPRWNDLSTEFREFGGSASGMLPLDLDLESGPAETSSLIGGGVQADFRAWRAHLEWLEGDVEAERTRSFEVIVAGRPETRTEEVDFDGDVRLIALSIAVPVFLSDEGDFLYSAGVFGGLNSFEVELDEKLGGFGAHAGLFGSVGWRFSEDLSISGRLEVLPFMRSFNGEVEVDGVAIGWAFSLDWRF
jgi:hypothetical protein